METTDYRIWDNAEKSFVPGSFKTEQEAETTKHDLLARGMYPDRPHTVYQIVSPCKLIENDRIAQVKQDLTGCLQLLNEIFKRSEVKDGRATFSTSEETLNTYKKFVKEIEANAKLIAAAPDLLHALEVAAKTIRAWHGEHAWDLYQNSPEMRAINNAIKKATE